jgi:hypothetical protein
MSAPDKIWAFGPTTFDDMDVWQAEPHELATSYTRSDLIPALIAEAVAQEREACAEIAGKSGIYAARVIAAAIRARGQD